MAPTKLCFVTVGATASFNELVQATMSSNFISALERQGYTDLLIQYGKGGKAQYDQAVSKAAVSKITTKGFELDSAGLNKYMREARGDASNASEGVVISHAGSGTILDALRMSVPLIVVPNTSLLDNHQVDLAEALAEQGYVIHGQLSRLSEALVEAETMAKKHKEWPPVNSGVHRQAKGLTGILDEEMGFLD